MNKKIIIISSIIIVILLVAFGSYKVIDIKREQEEDKVALTLKSNLNVEFGTKFKVSDFIEDLKGTLINDNEIEADTLGEKTITFKYKSIRNKEKSKTFNINIIDTVKPSIYIDNPVNVKVGYEEDVVDLIFSGDNEDSSPERKIIGTYDVNKEGKYNLTYSIKDRSGNEEMKDFVLNVTNDKIVSTNKNIVKFEDAIKTYKKENTKLGIDVSQWQGDIDFGKVKEAGAEFVIIRLGYQKGYDKDNALDPYFIKNIEGVQEAGLDVGIYFYSYAKTIKEAEEQAKFVSNNLKGYNINLPIAFDWESWSSFVKCNMSFYDINKVASTFIKVLEDNGYKASLYSSKNYLQRVWLTDDFENIWLAHYTKNTDYDKDYYLWQMCNTGRIAGINGDVDIDILFNKK